MIRFFLSRAIFVIVIGAGVLSGARAEIAASIRYDIIDRPVGLSDDFKPSDDVELRFLAIRAMDGSAIQGALWQPKSKPVDTTTLVVMIHGSGSSYRLPPQSSLGPRLAAKGYAALAIDTRQHDERINTDNFFDIRRDVEAAVYTARALGYRKLVLQGHSLGNIHVQFYAAANWDPDIKAVILLAPFGNLPWKTRNILVQNEDDFRRLIASAQKGLREGGLAEPLDQKMHYFTGQDVPVTAQHFLTYRWDKTSAADGTFWIRRVPYPVFVMRDQSDGVVLPFEPNMLLDAAHAEGSLVKSIEFTLLPDGRPPSLSSHSFIGNEQPLADAVTAWLAKQGL